MNRKNARVGQKVEAGRPYTDDYDEGLIVELAVDGTAKIAWQSGVITIADISELRAGWSGRFSDR